jgi:hypothetical protein
VTERKRTPPRKRRDGKRPARKRPARKPPARKPPAHERDERAALLAALPRLLVKFGRSRIDALERLYDAAHREARRALARTIAKSKRRADVRQARARFERAAAALKRSFADDAKEESDAVRRLQASIVSALSMAKDEMAGALEGWAEISWAFAEWSWEARWRRLAQQRRLASWVAAQTPATHKPPRELRKMFDRAQRAVASMKQDEDAFRKQADDEHAQVVEWTRYLDRARSASAADLATEAESRVAQHEAIARELEAEVAAAAASRRRLERTLGDLRAHLPR